jgi:hypothetical protein
MDLFFARSSHGRKRKAAIDSAMSSAPIFWSGTARRIA